MPGWPCRRLVIEGMATLTEVYTTLSIDDVMDMLDTADIYNDAMNPPTPPSPLSGR